MLLDPSELNWPDSPAGAYEEPPVEASLAPSESLFDNWERVNVYEQPGGGVKPLFTDEEVEALLRGEEIDP